MSTPEIPLEFDLHVDTLIIGAGACGLVAALAAKESGQQVLVVEADAVPQGSTALSAGLIPAAGTQLQRAKGIADTSEQFAADIQAKAHHENDLVLVDALAQGAAQVIDWLVTQHGLPFSLVDDFDYPGHTHRRMHGLPTRSGAELIDALRAACEAQSIDIACRRRALTLHVDGGQIRGVTVQVDDGSQEHLRCNKLILACNGFGGNREMVANYMPGIVDGLWFGHDGNRGDAVRWGEQVEASISHLAAFQGHGNVATPHGILITWAVITQGGIQVNTLGHRFWDESQGYSEAARVVLSQPSGTAITVFDERIAATARQFEDFKQAMLVGAVQVFDDIEALAKHFAIPADALQCTVAELPAKGMDTFGRQFDAKPLTAPFYGVRVTGALFHTQGGLDVDTSGRVKRRDGGVMPNLFAGGGAACGVSGAGDSGYLSGNGLLSAVVLGYSAGWADVEAID